jgi:hypothetical protein
VPACVDVATQLALMNQYRASIGLPPAPAAGLDLEPTKAMDVRVTKIFNLGGTQRLQAYLEAFNVLNFVNWSNGSGNMRSATFLISQPGGTARQIQWGARFSF